MKTNYLYINHIITNTMKNTGLIDNKTSIIKAEVRGILYSQVQLPTIVAYWIGQNIPKTWDSAYE